MLTLHGIVYLFSKHAGSGSVIYVIHKCMSIDPTRNRLYRLMCVRTAQLCHINSKIVFGCRKIQSEIWCSCVSHEYHIYRHCIDFSSIFLCARKSRLNELLLYINNKLTRMLYGRIGKWHIDCTRRCAVCKCYKFVTSYAITWTHAHVAFLPRYPLRVYLGVVGETPRPVEEGSRISAIVLIQPRMGIETAVGACCRPFDTRLIG